MQEEGQGCLQVMTAQLHIHKLRYDCEFIFLHIIHYIPDVYITHDVHHAIVSFD